MKVFFIISELATVHIGPNIRKVTESVTQTILKTKEIIGQDDVIVTKTVNLLKTQVTIFIS